MARPRLRFYCRGTALVTDPHAQERGNRRFVGRRWQELEPGTFVWAPTGNPEEIDYHADLVQACFEGDLWPADEATAKACRCGFDPNFGDEPTVTLKEFKAQLKGESPAPAPAPAPKAEEPKKAEQPGKPGGKD